MRLSLPLSYRRLPTLLRFSDSSGKGKASETILPPPAAIRLGGITRDQLRVIYDTMPRCSLSCVVGL